NQRVIGREAVDEVEHPREAAAGKRGQNISGGAIGGALDVKSGAVTDIEISRDREQIAGAAVEVCEVGAASAFARIYRQILGQRQLADRGRGAAGDGAAKKSDVSADGADAAEEAATAGD